MITNVAIRRDIDNFVWSLPKPNRHHHIIKVMSNAGVPDPVTKGCTQGFLDKDGNFLDRITAVQYVTECGQLTGKLIAPPRLYSEDLW